MHYLLTSCRRGASAAGRVSRGSLLSPALSPPVRLSGSRVTRKPAAAQQIRYRNPAALTYRRAPVLHQCVVHPEEPRQRGGKCAVHDYDDEGDWGPGGGWVGERCGQLEGGQEPKRSGMPVSSFTHQPTQPTNAKPQQPSRAPHPLAAASPPKNSTIGFIRTAMAISEAARV